MSNGKGSGPHVRPRCVSCFRERNQVVNGALLERCTECTREAEANRQALEIIKSPVMRMFCSCMTGPDAYDALVKHIEGKVRL